MSNDDVTAILKRLEAHAESVADLRNDFQQVLTEVTHLKVTLEPIVTALRVGTGLRRFAVWIAPLIPLIALCGAAYVAFKMEIRHIIK